METPEREKPESLSPLKRAIIELREMRAKLDDAERRQHEPIAIVGYGMRMPGGVVDEDTLWQLLANGVHAVQEIPRDRWDLAAYYDADPDRPGKMNARHAAFIDDVAQFDADFFGISPREAASLDPQQRLLLETAWHALEHAGIPAARLMGAPAGVFVGLGNSDYNRLAFGDEGRIDAYSALGNCYSVAAGRLSYFLGCQGPSLIVDTACSASLVALHLACQSLRQGECSLALAAGVNLILTPDLHINFSKSRMLALDGRCKTFDAGADGYVRGEGCVVVVLKRLSSALADGDRVLGLVRGSAINQDGRSGGLTAPNGPAQEAVIRAALANAGIAPNEVSYLEAHGTGTPLGDPIEVRAAAAVLCRDRTAGQPLALGSIKTNVGHLEGAAGLAGLLKVLLAFRHRQIPPHLHLQQKNPYIDWSVLPIDIPTRLTRWNPPNGRRIAGLSSFGFSGSNAHIILEEPPPRETAKAPPPVTDRHSHVLTLSTRDPAALQQLAVKYARHLAPGSSSGLADVCFSANAGRTHFPHRVSILAGTSDELRRDLESFATGAFTPRMVAGEAGAQQMPPVALMFTGQGSQYIGMGRELYETSLVFRQALDRCDEILQPLLPERLLSVVYPRSGSNSLLNETRYTQPALFAIGYALGEMWRSCGIQPAFVLGHSVGEYVAACFAGVFTLADGLRLIAERSRLMQALPPGGRMTAVFAPPTIVHAALARAPAVSVAAINGPELVVISGPGPDVQRVVEQVTAQGVKTKDLQVSHAFHSSLLDPMLASLEQQAATVAFAAPITGLVSNLTGEPVNEDTLRQPGYWGRHAREPVQFLASMRTLMARGIRVFIEAGPNPVLLGMARRCIDPQGALWLPSLRAGRSDWTQMLESLQACYAAGAAINWAALDQGQPRTRVSLPGYPFQRRHYWLPAGGRTTPAREAGHDHGWQAIKLAGARQSGSAPLGVNVASYPAKWDALRRLTTAHAAAALAALGAFARAGEAHDVDSLLRQTGIAPTYRHLVHRWLVRLAESGMLQQHDDAFVSSLPLSAPHLPAMEREVAEVLADDPDLLAYVRNCGARLIRILAGKESPLETLFPEGSSELAERLYEGAGMNRYANAIAGAVMQAAARSHPDGREFRVLEVGAGTGSTTRTILPLLDSERSTYVFTDLSDLFLGRARKKFASFPFTRFAVFDLEKPLEAQGFSPNSFDVVAGTNVVHAARNLNGALDRIRSLLVPGGFLLLVEATQHHDWFDFTTGLIEGWQHFADDIRGDNPLLPPGTWERVLRERGFTDVAVFPEADSPAQILGQHVIVARVRPPGQSDDSSAAPALGAIVADVAAVAITSPDGDNLSDPAIVGFRERLAAALPDERVELIDEYVRGRVMAVLRLETDRRPDRRHRLMDLGLDSLMAVQLRNLLEAGLGLDRTLPATLMFDYPTIEAISTFLEARLVDTDPAPVAAASAPSQEVPSTQRAQEIEAMSDDEAEALLLKRLERK